MLFNKPIIVYFAGNRRARDSSMAIATLGHSTRSCTISGGGTVDMQQNSGALNDSQIANASVSR